MKDDYRWYNSVLFNKRDQLTQNWPSEKERMNNDWRLKPFQGIQVGGKKPVATAEQPLIGDDAGKSNLNDLIVSNYGPIHPSGIVAAPVMDGQPEAGHSDPTLTNIGGASGCQDPGCSDRHGAQEFGLRTLKGELIACCGAGVRPVDYLDDDITANLKQKGPSPNQMNVVESMHEENQEDALTHLQQIETANKRDSNRDPNKFTQYGGWTTEGLGDKSMYGINHTAKNKAIVKKRYEGDQEESCRSRLLMGHGLQISQVRLHIFKQSNLFSSETETSDQQTSSVMMTRSGHRPSSTLSSAFLTQENTQLTLTHTMSTQK